MVTVETVVMTAHSDRGGSVGSGGRRGGAGGIDGKHFY